jgi:hypothetical protein
MNSRKLLRLAGQVRTSIKPPRPRRGTRFGAPTGGIPAIVETFEVKVMLSGTDYNALGAAIATDFHASVQLQQTLNYDAAEMLAAAKKARVEGMASRISIAIDDADTRVDGAISIAEDTVEELEERFGEDYDLQEEYDAKVAGINQQSQDRLNQIGQDFNDAVNAANQQLDDSLAAATDARDAAFAQISSEFAAQLDQIQTDYSAAADAAEAAFAAAEAAAEAAYQAALSAAWATFDSTRASAEATRDAALASVSSPVSTTVADSDPTYQAALQAAEDAYEAALDSANSAYETTMLGLVTTYNAAIQAANSAFEAAVDAADAAHAAAVLAASNGHSAAVQSAANTFDSTKQSLLATFESTVLAAVDTYEDAADAANAQAAADLATAESTYSTSIATAQATYDAFVAAVPGKYKNDIKAAGGSLVQAILDAFDAAKQARNAAGEAFATAVRGATEGLATALDGMADAIESLVSGVIQGHSTVIEQAWDDYCDALGNFDSSGYGDDMEAAQAAYQAHMTAATVAMYNTVGNDAISRLESLKGSYPGQLEGVYSRIKTWVDALGNADKDYSVAMARAGAAYSAAVEIADTSFLSTIASKKSGYEKEIKAEAQKLAIAKVKAENKRERDIAKANHQKATTIAEAAKALEDAIAEADKTYSAGYAEAWDTFQESLTTAWETLQASLSTADTSWVTAVIVADSAWITTVTAATSSYTAGATTAYSSAILSITSAVTNYYASTGSAWAAAVNSYYNGSADAETTTSAWLTYIDTVVTAWTTATSASTSAVNSHASTMTSTSNTRLESLSTAAQNFAQRSDAAAVTATNATVAAQRSYDDSVTSALVVNANALAQAEYSRATSTAANAEVTIKALANEYKTTIHKYADDHESAHTSFYTNVGSAAAEAIGAAYGIVSQIFSESIAESGQIVQEAAQKAENEAIAQKARATKVVKLAGDMASLGSKRGFDERIEEIRDFLDGLSGQTFGGVGISEAQRFSSSLVAYPPGIIESAKTAAGQLLDRIDSEEAMTEGYGASAYTGGATAEVMAAIFPSGQTEIRDRNGTFVGYHDHAAGDVWRWIPTASGGRTHGYRPLDAVLEMADTVSPGFNSRDWDAFFGGAPAVNEPEPQSLSYKAITFFITEEQLAAPGGLTSDILLTATLVTDIVGTVDPTGASDVIGAAAMAANGDYAGAATTLAGAAIPGSAETFLGLAKRVPVSKLDNASAGIARAQAKVSAKAADCQPSLTKLCKPEADCPEGCFAAGTPVLVGRRRTTSVATLQLTERVDSQDVAAITLLTLGLGANLIRQRQAAQTTKQLNRRRVLPKSKRTRTSSTSAGVVSKGRDVQPRSPKCGQSDPTRTDSRRQPCGGFIATETLSVRNTRSVTPRSLHSSSLSLLACLMIACFGAAGWLGVKNTSDAATVRPQSDSSFNVQAIDTIRLGQRIEGRHPVRSNAQGSSTIIPDDWRSIHLSMSMDSVDYHLAFLRPVSWIVRHNAQVGGRITLVMQEMGLNGTARVTAIEPCPPIEVDTTNARPVVTGTMRHLSSDIIQLSVGASLETLHVTRAHPFWSADRMQFVAAGDLRVGEKLLGADGRLACVSQVVKDNSAPRFVYNLEVGGEHVYHVGVSGLLVHNSCVEELYRFGTDPESASRLQRRAQEAQAQIGIHGVSVSGTKPTIDYSTANKHELSQHFPVHETPTRSDPLHHTVELPNPVTREDAALFNELFGR